MNQFSFDAFHQVPIVGILRGNHLQQINQIIDCYRTVGFTTVEITMNSLGAADLIQSLTQEASQDFNIGAGTVCTMEDLEVALQAGAQFIVTPIVNRAVIKHCLSQNIPVFPGAYTPTEVFQAWEAGATAVKIFPAVTGGLTHIKALKGPLNHIPMIPTGGVSADNIAHFFNLDIYGVGMGSQLFPKALITTQNWDALRKQLTTVMNAYLQWKMEAI